MFGGLAITGWTRFNGYMSQSALSNKVADVPVCLTLITRGSDPPVFGGLLAY